VYLVGISVFGTNAADVTVMLIGATPLLEAGFKEPAKTDGGSPARYPPPRQAIALAAYSLHLGER
jgi:hypothetical protein